MTRINTLPLEFYLDKIRRGEPFMFARYGDGEWYAIGKRTRHNIDHHRYFPKMGDELLLSLLRRKSTPNYFLALQSLVLMLDEPKKIFEDYVKKYGLEDIYWHNSDVFHQSLANGSFKRVVEELNKQNVIFVGPAYLREIQNTVHYHTFFEIPLVDCYLKKDDLKEQILEKREVGVYCFSASMMTEVLLDELCDLLPGSTLIDMGAVWDYGLGRNTRTWNIKS